VRVGVGPRIAAALARLEQGVLGLAQQAGQRLVVARPERDAHSGTRARSEPGCVAAAIASAMRPAITATPASSTSSATKPKRVSPSRATTSVSRNVARTRRAASTTTGSFPARTSSATSRSTSTTTTPTAKRVPERRARAAASLNCASSPARLLRPVSRSCPASRTCVSGRTRTPGLERTVSRNQIGHPSCHGVRPTNRRLGAHLLGSPSEPPAAKAAGGPGNQSACPGAGWVCQTCQDERCSYRWPVAQRAESPPRPGSARPGRLAPAGAARASLPLQSGVRFGAGS
jgi:hypothetical protein